MSALLLAAVAIAPSLAAQYTTGTSGTASTMSTCPSATTTSTSGTGSTAAGSAEQTTSTGGTTSTSTTCPMTTSTSRSVIGTGPTNLGGQGDQDGPVGQAEGSPSLGIPLAVLGVGLALAVVAARRRN